MSKIKQTPKLATAVRNLIVEADKNAQEVGLLMRWNNNDNLMWTIWSESMNHDGKETRYGGGAARNIGGHAEEILIKNWLGYRREARILPQIVDIILTQSPCLDRSQSFKINNTVWPPGCAQKLLKLINDEEVAVKEWRIAYLNVYQEGRVVDAQSHGAIGLLSTNDKVTIGIYRDMVA